MKKFFSHKKAIVDSPHVGRGTRIWAFSHVMDGVELGSDCNIGEQVFIESGAVVGDRVTVKNGVKIWDGVVVESDVFIGPDAVFTNDKYPRSPRSPAAGDRYATKGWRVKTVIKEGASIGANATILCGLTIGRFATVGAGAVVTESVPDFALVGGNPAKYLGAVCRCGRPLGRSGTRKCLNCGRKYLIRGKTTKETRG